MKNLVIRPADVSLDPLGDDSSTASVEVSVAYDRDVTLRDGRFTPKGVPIVKTSLPPDGLSVPVVPNDDPDIVSGQGFGVHVRLVFYPKSGSYRQVVDTTRTLVITSSISDDTISVGDPRATSAISMPALVPGSQVTGIAVWTDPVSGERVPYLTSPSDGTLTTIGA